jgi:transposase InsO family protein
MRRSRFIEEQIIRVDHKRVYRRCREEDLELPKRRRTRLLSVRREPLVKASGIKQRRLMGFMSDSVADGRRLQDSRAGRPREK